MIKLLLLKCCICIALLSGANTIIVKNADELKKAGLANAPSERMIRFNVILESALEDDSESLERVANVLRAAGINI